MRILCYGDSNTYGYDPRSYFGGRYDVCDRWPELLARMTGHTVINAGRNGRTIPNQPGTLHEHDLLLVMLGTNDLLEGASARETAARMKAFLTRCAHVLLVSPPPMKRGAWVPSDELVTASVLLAEEYRAIAQALSVPFIDTSCWDIELTFDGVHFTETGHHVFAAMMKKALDSPPTS